MSIVTSYVQSSRIFYLWLTFDDSLLSVRIKSDTIYCLQRKTSYYHFLSSDLRQNWNVEIKNQYGSVFVDSISLWDDEDEFSCRSLFVSDEILTCVLSIYLMTVICGDYETVPSSSLIVPGTLIPILLNWWYNLSYSWYWFQQLFT